MALFLKRLIMLVVALAAIGTVYYASTKQPVEQQGKPVANAVAAATKQFPSSREPHAPRTCRFTSKASASPKP